MLPLLSLEQIGGKPYHTGAVALLDGTLGHPLSTLLLTGEYCQHEVGVAVAEPSPPPPDGDTPPPMAAPHPGGGRVLHVHSEPPRL